LLLATDTWTGTTGNGFWSFAANWDHGVPNSGDDLVFPEATLLQLVNDLNPGITFHSITLNDRTGIGGNAIFLTGGITVPPPLGQAGGSVANMGISLAGNQTFSGSLHIYGPVDLAGFTLTCDGTIFNGPVSANGTVSGRAIFFNSTLNLYAPSQLVASTLIQVSSEAVNLNQFNLTLDGATTDPSVTGFSASSITGSGGIIKNGTGTWTLGDQAAYTGSTVINAGTLKTSVLTSSPMVSGGVLEATGTIAGSVTVAGGTLAAPGGLISGPLAFNAASTFSVQLNGQTPGTTYSQVQVNGPINLGGATLNANLTFVPNGPTGFIILQSTDMITGTFNGLAEGASLTLNGQTFHIHYYNPSPGFPGRVVLSNDPGVTATAVTSSQSPASSLVPPTLTASVGAVGMNAVNGATPVPPGNSGTVTFMDGNSPLARPVPVMNGFATLTPLLTAGSHSITAVFTSTNPSFSGSTSNPFVQVTTSTPMGWRDVLTGDFNGDGKQDIAGRDAAGHWWVALSTGSGFLNELWTIWSTGVTWLDVQRGDFNGDGKADIAGRASNGQWWVALSTGSGFDNHLWDTWNSGVTWVDVKVGDFNGDGKSDIVGRYLQGGTWWVGLSNGSGFSTTQWATWSTGATWVDVNVGDFNGDGKADIAGRALQNGQWYVGLSDGSTRFTTTLWDTWSTAATWVDVKVGDFNGDGKSDLTGRYLEGGSWWTAISNGAKFTTTSWGTWSTAATWVDVRVGDFNGDGKADLTGRYLEGGSWWTAISNGTSFTTTHWDTWSASVNWVDVLAADFTGAGKASIAGRYFDGGSWWTGVSSDTSFSTTLWTTWPP
jgi:autotransporter-associated beta strand protein